MSIFTIATYSNHDDDDPERGGTTEFDMGTEAGDETVTNDVYVADETTVQMRLEEAICINLAELAASSDRIAKSLETLAKAWMR